MRPRVSVILKAINAALPASQAAQERGVLAIRRRDRTRQGNSTRAVYGMG